MDKIVFDGYVYSKRKAGAYRYSNEILLALDTIIQKNQYYILLPPDANGVPEFKNIGMIHLGKYCKGLFWEQFLLPLYCMKNKLIPISFYNITPLLRPGIVVVHDIGYKLMKHTYRNLYGRLSSLWHRLNYWVIAKSNKPIITVSETSKQEIMQVYGVSDNRITVVGNGWQHINNVLENDCIISKYPQIKKKEYFFSLGSLEERKNFRWVLEVAKRNPNKLFVIAGKASPNAKDKLDVNEISNVLMLGFVDDGTVKWLMHNCKAFLFPSIYEGFGIPPLEALALGAEVLCAQASCMPEICEDAVGYFDPCDYNMDLDELLRKIDTTKRERVLSKYSWKKSAEMLCKLIYP